MNTVCSGQCSVSRPCQNCVNDARERRERDQKLDWSQAGTLESKLSEYMKCPKCGNKGLFNLSFSMEFGALVDVTEDDPYEVAFDRATEHIYDSGSSNFVLTDRCETECGECGFSAHLKAFGKLPKGWKVSK